MNKEEIVAQILRTNCHWNLQQQRDCEILAAVIVKALAEAEQEPAQED